LAEIITAAAIPYILNSDRQANAKEALMPMITLQYATLRRRADLAKETAEVARRLSSEILHKDPDVTAVVVEEVDPSKWFVAGKSLSEHGQASFWLDIRIVDGTNTREEKAAFVAAAFAKMNELIGPLHPESYVHVDDVRGDAYGYGGVTQNERYIATKLKLAEKIPA
jgi:4-oxalocrotonate tautomerase